MTKNLIENPNLLNALVPEDVYKAAVAGEGEYDPALLSDALPGDRDVSLIDGDGLAFAVCVELPNDRFPDPDSASLIVTDGEDDEKAVFAIWRLRAAHWADAITLPKGASFSVPASAGLERMFLEDGHDISIPWDAFGSAGAQETIDLDIAGAEVYDANGYSNDAPLIGWGKDGESIITERVDYLPDRKVEMLRAPTMMTKAENYKAFKANLGDYLRRNLTNHAVAKQKNNGCVVFGSGEAQMRLRTAMGWMECVALDLDGGQTVNDTISRVRDAGFSCVGYTTWSHRKTTTKLPRDQVMKKMKCEGEPTLEECREFLLTVRNIKPEILETLEIVSRDELDDKGAMVLTLSHRPIEKMRLVFPLSETLHLIEKGRPQADAVEEYRERTLGLADALGLHVDTSAADMPRLFFGPSHAAGNNGWRTFVVRGKPLVYTSLRRMTVNDFREKMRGRGNVYAEAGMSMGGGTGHERALSPSGRDLKRFWAKYGQRFYLTEFLEEYLDHDQIRKRGTDGVGKLHVECPNEASHSSMGGTGCYVTDGETGDERWGNWFCTHDSCSGMKTADRIAMAMAEGWFPEEAFFDEQWLEPAEMSGDGKEDDDGDSEGGRTGHVGSNHLAGVGGDERDPEAKVERGAVEAEDDGLTHAEILEQIEDDMRALIAVKEDGEPEKVDYTALEKLIEEYAQEGGSRIQFAAIITEVASAMRINKTPLNDQFKAHLTAINRVETARKKEAERKRQKEAREQEEQDKAKAKEENREEMEKEIEKRGNPPILGRTPPNEVCQYIRDNLAPREGEEPPVYSMSGALVSIDRRDPATTCLTEVGMHNFRALVTRKMEFIKMKGNDVMEFVAPPLETTNLVYHDIDYPVIAARLKRVVNAPYMNAKGEIITEGGYNPVSELYYDDPGLNIRPIPAVPEQRHMDEALKWIHEMMYDFCFDGIKPGEIMDGAMNTSYTHAVAMCLGSFCEDMIDGQKPLFVVSKPTPGTGGSFLAEAFGIVIRGDTPNNIEWKENEKERNQQVFSAIGSGEQILYFDNVPATSVIDSASIASIATSGKITERVLFGQTNKTFPVTATCVFTGNNVQMSNEITRRALLIHLDTNLPQGTVRQWRHKRYHAWIKKHRADLIWSFLVILQNWVAKGKPEGEVRIPSFESWSDVVGGALLAAGFTGLFADREKLAENSQTDDLDDFRRVIPVIWEMYGDQEWGLTAFNDPNKPGLKGDTKKSDGACRFLIEDGLTDLPVKVDRNHDEIRYNSSSLGNWFKQFQERVIPFEDAEGVTRFIKLMKTRTSSGMLYRLVEKADPNAWMSVQEAA